MLLLFFDMAGKCETRLLLKCTLERFKTQQNLLMTIIHQNIMHFLQLIYTMAQDQIVYKFEMPWGETGSGKRFVNSS